MMSSFLWFLLTLPAALSFLLTLFLALEIFGAFAPRRRVAGDGKRPARIAIIIPAHNEGAGVIPTIEDVKAQMQSGDRIIVVADNCTDDTAAIARAAGAQCLERSDHARRGKGYALQFALDAIRDDPPDAVFFIDADCRLGAEALARTTAAAMAQNRPAQALNLMQAPAGAPPGLRVSEFAWLLVNKVRMSGLYRLFDTARLTGTGMALPWSLANNLAVGSGEIVEDLSLSLDLAAQGAAPMMVADGLITSEFPIDADAAAKQRARWEHGSLSFARRNIFRLFLTSIVRGNSRLAMMAFDLAIPPLILFLALLLSVLAFGAGVAIFFSLYAPLILAGLASLIFGLSIFAAWFVFGRDVLPLRFIGEVFSYALAKRHVYNQEARSSTKSWTRTERGAGGGNNSDNNNNKGAGKPNRSD